MSAHLEFPLLRAETIELLTSARARAGGDQTLTIASEDRRFLSGFLRALIEQTSAELSKSPLLYNKLMFLAGNLHSPPPLPPTLAKAKEAALHLVGPSAEVVHAFLATLEVEP